MKVQIEGTTNDISTHKPLRRRDNGDTQGRINSFEEKGSWAGRRNLRVGIKK